MPIFEYKCNDCRKKITLLILNRSVQPACNLCGGSNLTRLLSRFASPKSEEARLESMTDPGKWGDLDENDPASMARVMKKMGKEFGDELGGDFEEELDSAVEEAAHGEYPAGEDMPPEM